MNSTTWQNQLIPIKHTKPNFEFVSTAAEYEQHRSNFFNFEQKQFKSIKGIREIHCVIPDLHYTLITKNYSKSDVFRKNFLNENFSNLINFI